MQLGGGWGERVRLDKARHSHPLLSLLKPPPPAGGLKMCLWESGYLVSACNSGYTPFLICKIRGLGLPRVQGPNFLLFTHLKDVFQ